MRLNHNFESNKLERVNTCARFYFCRNTT